MFKKSILHLDHLKKFGPALIGQVLLQRHQTYQQVAQHFHLQKLRNKVLCIFKFLGFTLKPYYNEENPTTFCKKSLKRLPIKY